MNGSNVTIVGNLTRDPELRFTTGGRAYTNLGVAVNRRYQVQGEWKDDVSFFNVTCWGEMAEHVAESCPKGTRVVVTGRLDQREWEKDGEKRTSVEIVADEIAPSLRWATCTVNRTERSSSGSSGSAPASKSPDPIYGDEEPF